MFQKSGDAFKEIGLDIWNGLETRADKATDSWYDFGNYLTLGSLDLGKNMGAGLRYNTENRMNSTLDYINWMTIGGVDTIKAVVFPQESFSKDHWLSSFNLATVIAGGANARIVNNSTPNVSTKVPSVEKTPKTSSVPLVTRLPRLNTLTNIREWFRVNVPEIGLVYDTIGGYHFMVWKGDGGSFGSGRAKGIDNAKDINKLTVDDIPTAKSGNFNKFFNSLTSSELDELWKDKKIRKKIERQLREPGGLHEWHLVSRAPQFKHWNISVEEIKDLRTAISDVKFVNPNGVHGGLGSTKAHNELLAIIDTSSDYNTFVRRLNNWANYRLEGGVPSLPEGLRLK